MKRVFLPVLLLVISITNTLYAQSNNVVSASVDVHAKVVQSIELITVNTLNFSNLQPEQKTLYINPVNDLNSGFMIALGTANAAFRIEYVPQQKITQANGTGDITFRYEIAGNTEEDQATSEILRQENRDIIFNREGRYYFWIGGSLDLEHAEPGSYHADFTIEIEYI